MLTIVMEKPMQLTIVSAVPFISPEAFWATRVEKRGESAITTMPQNSMKPINKFSYSTKNTNGEIRQQPHESRRAVNAVFLVPIFCDTNPPNTHASPPIPIIINDKKGILNEV